MKKLVAACVFAGGVAAASAGYAADVPTCMLLATGGTIAMKNDPVSHAPVPAVSGEELLASVPQIGETAHIEVNNLSNVPSSYMDEARWTGLQRAAEAALKRPEVAGVIVSHGTDTLEETAYFLDLTVASDKPVILIGSQRNGSDFDFDGPRNLINAARLCGSPLAKGKGAMLVMNGQINAAREVTKTHTSDVETFKSGDAGFLGNLDEDRIVFYRSPVRRQHIDLLTAPLPYVEIVPTYGGVKDTLIRAAIAAGAKGIVVQALGWGNVSIPISNAIKDAIKAGIPVVISTRVPNGRVLPHYGYEGGGKALHDAGAVMADNLSPQKARILLMLALQTTHDRAELQKFFDK